LTKIFKTAGHYIDEKDYEKMVKFEKVDREWRKNSVLGFVIIYAIIPLIGIILLGLFIAHDSNYDYFDYVMSVFMETTLLPIMIFLYLFIYLVYIIIFPKEFKITEDGIMVQFSSKSNEGHIPWSDIFRVKWDPILRNVTVMRRSSGSAMICKMNKSEYEYINRKVNNDNRKQNPP